MNELQTVIFNIIVNISNTPGAFDHGNSIFNPIRLFISRYSLANDEYYVTENAFALFGEYNLTIPLLRSRLKELKDFFTYEHPVTSSFVLHHIINSNRTREEIRAILNIADCVTIVTKQEDRLISEKHKSKMPQNWNHLTDYQFARYELCNVQIREEKITVFGALQN